MYSHINKSNYLVSTKKRVLSSILEREINLTVYERGIPNFTDGWLVNLKVPNVRDKVFTVTENDFEKFPIELEHYIRSIGKTLIVDIVNWLVIDIEENIKDFIAFTKAQSVLVNIRPNSIGNTSPVRYHRLMKMICIYGPGHIKWTDKAISQKTGPLDVMIFKGQNWPGLLQESFAVGLEGSPETNSLLLEIEYQS